VIANPNTMALCPSDTLGEIWINAASLVPSGFFALPKLSQSIFRAQPLVYTNTMGEPEDFSYRVINETAPHRCVTAKVIQNAEFLKTGLMGFIVNEVSGPNQTQNRLGTMNPRLFIVGVKNDLILQPKIKSKELNYYFTSDLAETLMSKVSGIDCW